MLLDIVKGLPFTPRVTLLAEGPFAEQLRRDHISVAVSPVELKITKSSGLLRSLSSAFPFWKQLRFVIRQCASCDLIYANTPKAFVVGALAATWLRKPLVYHLHDILDRSHFSRINLLVLVQLSKWTATHIIANSQATADSLLSHGSGAISNRITVVPNGFDLGPFQIDRESRRGELRATLGVGPNTKVALIAGRLARWKGQHVLLEAIRGNPDWNAWVVGDAMFTDDDRAYKQELMNLASQTDLVGRVHFLGFRDDMLDLYAASDAVVHCSVAAEPFGRVIVEGMLSGKPVIATNAGGAKEILKDGITGWLTEPGDVQGLATALQVVAGDPEAAKRVALVGRLDAEQRFGLPKVLEAIEQVIQVCLK